MCSPIPDGVFYEVINKRSIKYKPPAKPAGDPGAPSNTAMDVDIPPNEAEASDPTVVRGPAAQVFLVEALWTRPFLAYLLRQELPEDQTEARRIVVGRRHMQS